MLLDSVVVYNAPSVRNLWLKLFGIFAVTTVAAFMFSLAWHSISNGMAEKAHPQPTDVESFPRLAANLPNRLEESYYPASTFNYASLVDPTQDAANLTNLRIAAVSAPQYQTPAAPLGTNQRVPLQNGFPAISGAPAVNNNGVQSTTVVPNNAVPVPPSRPDGEASARLQSYYRSRMRNEMVVPISSVFYLDEIIPVGFAGDISGREVLFFSESAKKTFASPIGSIFKDGTLLSVAEDGVSFQTPAGVRFIPWSRRDSKSTGNSAYINPDNTVRTAVPMSSPEE